MRHAMHDGKTLTFGGTAGLGGKDFFAVSPLLIRPRATGPFNIYLLQNGKHVLYAREGEAFTEFQRKRLFDMGVGEVYLRGGDRKNFDNYLEDSLGPLLEDESVPLEERAGAMYAASLSVIGATLKERMPQNLPAKSLERVVKVAAHAVKFLSGKDALKHMGKMVSQGFGIYTHSVNTMLFTSALLAADSGMDKGLMRDVAVGAMLHDIGKTRVDKRVVDKDPEMRGEDENEAMRRHPVLGSAVTATVPLAAESMHCILFHHERPDGMGYPTGLREDNIPEHVRAVSICNAYDALTTETKLQPGRTPFEALQHMKADMGGFDPHLLKRFIMVLSSAEMV